jgi:hypothetical protein
MAKRTPIIIRLPDGGGMSFDAWDLVDFVRNSGRDYIIQGQQKVAQANHTKRRSLDYWLREKYAKNPDVKQASNEVVDELVATGLFEECVAKCPDKKTTKCKGIRLTKKALAA